jgi:adenylate cyclase
VLRSGTDRAAQASADSQRTRASARVSDNVSAYLAQGEAVVLRLEARLKQGLCLAERTESCLAAELLSNTELAEVTFTAGEDQGYAPDGEVKLAPEGRKLVSVYRARPGRDSEICTRVVTGEDGKFLGKVTCKSPYDVLDTRRPPRSEDAVDPTEDFAFSMPASEGRRGRTLFTDLSYSALDAALPEAQRRVVVTFMRAVEDTNGKLTGVMKAGLTEGQLRALVSTEKVNNAADDPFKVFIADTSRKVVTAPNVDAQLVDDNDDLRIPAGTMPADLQAALQTAALTEVTVGNDKVGEFTLHGRVHHVTFHALDKTWGWAVGVVGPDDYYRKPLQQALDTTLLAIGLVLLFTSLGAILIWRTVASAFSSIADETQRMQAFKFDKSPPPSSRFADVRDVLQGVEKAKTAVRAMGKYVPLDLVHDLFKTNEDPRPGGNPREVTLMFSDIEGFTHRAEADPPDEVARWLGDYLGVMATTIAHEQGTVDKFIGDAVMAIWNAPGPVDDHAVRACRAALACEAACAELYASEKWKGRAPLVTRIGLHVGGVFVGLFGAPNRLSYTAIGDSVNLAARLESLNKQYGTRLLASEDVYERAKNHFAFRLLDKVAVKGKSKAIGVYELLGPIEQPALSGEIRSRYADALAVYTAGDFAKAKALFEQNGADAPSRTMAKRCAEFLVTPPLQPWTGVSAATEK